MALMAAKKAPGPPLNPCREIRRPSTLYALLVILLVCGNVYFASKVRARARPRGRALARSGRGEGAHGAGADGAFRPQALERADNKAGGDGGPIGKAAQSVGARRVGGHVDQVVAKSAPTGFKPLTCPEDVISWADAQPGGPKGGGKFPMGNNPLWFLHLPRTGGRCFHSCFLKGNFAAPSRCIASYDKFHAGQLYRDCHLLGSHDDYSIGHELEELGRTATVITLVRDPVDRFLSSYEFGLSNAARIPMSRMDQAPADALDDEALIENPKLGLGRKVSTQMVWPWSHVLPMIKGDMESRRQQDAHNNVMDRQNTKGVLDTIDPYDNQFYMSLEEFLENDLVKDHVVNGMTMQYAGITNNSHMAAPYNPNEIRACAQRQRSAGEAIVRLAKRRLDAMPFVGMTKHHHESVEIAAAALGFDLNATAHRDPRPGGDARPKMGSGGRRAGNAINSAAARSLLQDGAAGGETQQQRQGHGGGMQQDPTHPDPTQGDAPHNMTVGANYVRCSLKSSAGGAKKNTVGQIKFSKDTRAALPPKTLDRIREAHWMDAEIFAHGKAIFEALDAKYAGRGRLAYFETEQAKQNVLIT